MSKASGFPYLPSYLGGSAYACGTASTQITIPSGANMAYIHAAGAALYYTVNGASAGTASAGYVAQDNNGIVFAVDNLATLHVAGAAAAAVAHVEFYKDAQ
jgi:hypothetical protein